MKTTIALLSIILIGALLRLYSLGELPRGIYVDEASIGYNAWSILHSGKDEHHKAYPLTFQAFGEYKLPVYIYSSIPFIAIFGLNGISVRLVSALAGIIAVYGIYLLTIEISRRKATSLIAAALFALSPWSIHLSRGGFEANLGLTLIIFGTYFFLIYTNRNKSAQYLIYSGILYILALYTYNAERIFLPLLLLSLIILFRKNIFEQAKRNQSVIFILTIVVVIVTALTSSLIGSESTRVQQVMDFENKQYVLGPFLGVIQKYFVNFSPDFLFFSGDLFARHSVRELGELYLPQLPFLLVGLFLVCRSRTKELILLLIWLVLSPIPAAIATPVPHALRALLMLPPLTIITALGLEHSRAFFMPRARYIFMPIVSIIFAYSLFTYVHVYYNHYVYKTSWDWNENKSLVAQALVTSYPDANKILIETDPESIIYIKFFNASRNRTTDISRYYLTTDLSQVRPQDGDIVAINGWKGTPEQLKNVTELKMLNSSIGFKVGEWKNNE
ncbi:MAG: glycosyltransferase family 39 protein [bacterium]|nr:glycosyltransferase family 39 protein [bacterium]